MPRIVKEEAYAQKRNEILDAAQKLVYTQGYDEMSIQDILNLTGISKGAFYHYFDSKPDLLEALIDRMVQESAKILLPIVHDPDLPALEKLQKFFDAMARWKSARKELLLPLFRVWYADENALVRDKVIVRQFNWAAEWLAYIFRQGIAEKVMDMPFPDKTAQATLAMLTGLSNAFARMILSPPQDGSALQTAFELTQAYNQAFERMLGAPSGSLILMDDDTVRGWIEMDSSL